jgi:hypothetical protein
MKFVFKVSLFVCALSLQAYALDSGPANPLKCIDGVALNLGTLTVDCTVWFGPGQGPRKRLTFIRDY